MYYNKRTFYKLTVILVVLFVVFSCSYIFSNTSQGMAMPFYDLQPHDLVLRSQFYTSYSSSSDERKSNIATAAKSINNVLVDVGGEFSFNLTVGPRTENRGYKSAKIIVNGEFVDGVGGGVCQVSTTLYNAALIAGLSIIEFHPHSLSVGYVAPSFDAMVNSGSADLKFVNNTHNPVIIYANADGKKLTVSIYGEPMMEKYIRKSVVKGEIPAPKEEEVFDENGEYPELYEGESMFIKYGKSGLISEGYLVVERKGKTVKTVKIRTDKYRPIRGIIMHGKAVKPELNEDENLEIDTEGERINVGVEEIFSKLKEKFLKYKKNFDKYNFL